MPKAKKEHWIQDDFKGHREGTLHKALHVPQDKKIPQAKLDEAIAKGGINGQRAQVVKTLHELHKKEDKEMAPKKQPKPLKKSKKKTPLYLSYMRRMIMDPQIKNILNSKTIIAAILAAISGAVQSKYGWVIDPQFQAVVLLPLLMVCMRLITKTPIKVLPAKKTAKKDE